MRKNKHNEYWFYPSYDQKPNNWKFVSRPFIYSSNVIVDNDITGKYIGTIELQYKLKNRVEFDQDWLNEKFIEVLGKIPKYETGYFKRDGSGIAFVKRIYLSDIEYKQITRELKLKRILNE